MPPASLRLGLSARSQPARTPPAFSGSPRGMSWVPQVAHGYLRGYGVAHGYLGGERWRVRDDPGEGAQRGTPAALTLIRRMAVTISTLLLGRGTSRLPMY